MRTMIGRAILLLCVAAGPGRAQTKPLRPFALRAESPRFWELLDHDAKLDTVATGFGFTEGPVWDPAGFVYVSDEELNKIFRVYGDGHREEVISLGDPDGNTYDREHHLIDCASVLRAIIKIEPNGQYEILADRFQGKKLNSPNDVVSGPDGDLFHRPNAGPGTRRKTGDSVSGSVPVGRKGRGATADQRSDATKWAGVLSGWEEALCR